MKAINVTLDKSERFLDKQRDIENNDGIKRTVDAFRVVSMAGKSVNVMFIGACAYVGRIPIMEKLKRVKYINGEMIINICGEDYCIGHYTEVV